MLQNFSLKKKVKICEIQCRIKILHIGKMKEKTAPIMVRFTASIYIYPATSDADT